MNSIYLHHKKLFTYMAIMLSSSLLTACGSNNSASISDNTASISGTVPGTKIEAFADNGAYYVVHSTDDGTTQHPFELVVPADMGLPGYDDQ